MKIRVARKIMKAQYTLRGSRYNDFQCQVAAARLRKAGERPARPRAALGVSVMRKSWMAWMGLTKQLDTGEVWLEHLRWVNRLIAESLKVPPELLQEKP